MYHSDYWLHTEKPDYYSIVQHEICNDIPLSQERIARLHDIPSTIILTMSSGPFMVYKIIPSQWNYEGNMLMA